MFYIYSYVWLSLAERFFIFSFHEVLVWGTVFTVTHGGLDIRFLFMAIQPQFLHPSRCVTNHEQIKNTSQNWRIYRNVCGKQVESCVLNNTFHDCKMKSMTSMKTFVICEVKVGDWLGLTDPRSPGRAIYTHIWPFDIYLGDTLYNSYSVAVSGTSTFWMWVYISKLLSIFTVSCYSGIWPVLAMIWFRQYLLKHLCWCWPIWS